MTGPVRRGATGRAVLAILAFLSLLPGCDGAERTGEGRKGEPGGRTHDSDATHGGAGAARRPNVLIVLLDDLGYSDLGAYGGEIRTPNIDALAENGLRFGQFYVEPRCSPTRAALLTGLHPHQAGMARLAAPAGREGERGPYQGYLTTEAPSLAALLGDAGYDVYMSGKWHLGESEAHWPLAYGFDRWSGFVSGASSYWEIIPPGERGQTRLRRMAIDDEVWTPPDEGFYMTDAITAWALEYLEQAAASDDSFFLYLAYTAPHWPLHAHVEDIRRYDGVYDAGWDEIARQRTARLETLGLIDADATAAPRPDAVPAWTEAPAERRRAWIANMQVYAAMVERADRGVGRLVEALRGNGALRDTLILVLSDNGPDPVDPAGRGLDDPAALVGSPASYRGYGPEGAFVSASPFRGAKKQTLEGGIRSPLVVHWPAGGVPAGAVNTVDAVAVHDIAPTLAALAGAPPLRRSAGRNIIDLLVGSGAEASANRTLFFEHEGNAAVLRGNRKAVLPSGAGWSEWELYDLAADPAETNDLAARERETAATLAAAWRDWADRVRVADDDARRQSADTKRDRQ